MDKIVLEKHHVLKGNPVNVEKALPKDQTNHGRMAVGNYGGPSGGGGSGSMRGPSSRMSGGWGPMGGESNFARGGSGGYRSGGGSGGGHGPIGDYSSRAGLYSGAYGSEMGGGSGGGRARGDMMNFGGSLPMGGGKEEYSTGGPPRGSYNDGKIEYIRINFIFQVSF